MTGQQPLRFAIVGCGKFGTHMGGFLRNEIPDATVTALVEPNDANRNRARDLLGRHLPTFTSIEELLDSAAHEIDAVFVASPNYVHRDHAIAAAHAGKHVFCEKPMAITSDDCRAMVHAAQQHGVRVMVGHKRRLRPTWRRLTEIAHSGELGEPVAININGWHWHPSYAPWFFERAKGGGLLHLAGVHDIDYMHAVMGEPAWVSAVCAPRATTVTDYPDVMWVRIGFARGAVGGLQVVLRYAPTHFRDSFCVQIMGTEASALLTRHLDGDQELSWGRPGQALTHESFADDATEAYRIELTSFIRWVRHGEPPVLTWREGWRCVQVMQAAYQSADAGGTPVVLEDLPRPV